MPTANIGLLVNLRDRYVGISGNKKRFDLAAYANAQHILVAPHGRNPGVVDSKHYLLNIFKLPLRLPELDIAVASHPRAMSDPAIVWLMCRDSRRRQTLMEDDISRRASSKRMDWGSE
jgi:hypothetical protein